MEKDFCKSFIIRIKQHIILQPVIVWLSELSYS